MGDNDEEEPMDTSETSCLWYYLADCGRWHRFEEDPDNPFRSEDIEKYFSRNSKGVLNSLSSNRHIKIDFSAMLRTDYITGGQVIIKRGYTIERRCWCFMAPPVRWEWVDPTCPYQVTIVKMTGNYSAKQVVSQEVYGWITGILEDTTS